jgi:hypothetical protein
VALVRPFVLDGKPRLLVVSNHYIWYPSQVALLDPANGALLGEYWHKGSIYRCVLHDLDGDHRPEVIFGALNNPGQGIGHAAVAVLNLPLDGSSRDYVLFPRADLLEATGELPTPHQLGVEDGRILFLSLLPGPAATAYYLDFRLNLLETRFSDNFGAQHRRAEAEGRLDHSFDAAEHARLSRVVHFPEAPDGNSPEVCRLLAGRATTASRSRAPVRPHPVPR